MINHDRGSTVRLRAAWLVLAMLLLGSGVPALDALLHAADASSTECVPQECSLGQQSGSVAPPPAARAGVVGGIVAHGVAGHGDERAPHASEHRRRPPARAPPQ